MYNCYVYVYEYEYVEWHGIHVWVCNRKLIDLQNKTFQIHTIPMDQMYLSHIHIKIFDVSEGASLELMMDEKR